jgi:hypothetical protein
MRLGLGPLLIVAACAAPSIGSYPEPSEGRAETHSPDSTPTADAGAPRSSTLGANVANLTVQLTGDGGGSVTSNPAGLTCDAKTCTGSFAKGTTVTLTATAASGALFGGWGGACTGTNACTPVINGETSVSVEFAQLDGTWSGKYTNTRTANGCTFNNAGDLSVAVTTNGTISTSAQITGLEIRSIPACNVIDSRSSSTTANVTTSGTTMTGTWEFAINGVSGTLAFPFKATVNGKTMTGTWDCATCIGSFTLIKP